jgi:hypothetical protein
MKQYRREEKRIARREKKGGEDGEVFGEGLSSFDPKELRTLRYQILKNECIAVTYFTHHYHFLVSAIEAIFVYKPIFL